MVSARRRQILAGIFLLAGVFGLISSPTVQGQDGDKGKGEKVHFVTVDGVKIEGMFYPGAKQSSPTVMMLHALGEDSRKKGWVALAETLNKDGNAVLTFDFRGHGQSREIDGSLFWKFPRNLTIKGAPKKVEIEFKDLPKEYYPVLVNDIAAAKAFLDNRNDSGSCNTASMIVLGAETGATLGGIWLNAECSRYVFTPANPLMGIRALIANAPEGKDTIACVWLSATSKLGPRTIPLTKLLELPGKQFATPMVFMYSDGDESSKKIALACAKALKGGKKDEKKFALTAAVPLVGGGKLSGAGLLQKSLGTDEAISQYIKEVAEARGHEWEQRDFRKTQYVWKIGPSAPIPAKLPMEKTLVFDTYERFLK